MAVNRRWHSPRRAVEVEAVNDLERWVERDCHDVKRAGRLTSRLINQDFALHLPPSESFVVTAHSIDAKEQREIYLPLLTEKVRGVAYQNGGMTASLGSGNCDHTPDPANKHVPTVGLRAVFEYCGMTDRTFGFSVEDEAKFLPVLGTIREIEVGGAEDVLAPSPELL